MSREFLSAERNAGPDTGGLMVAAQWLSGVFIAPLSLQQVSDASAAPGLNLLRYTGEQLDSPATAQKLCNLLVQDTPEKLTVHLQRRYTALFEGIFRYRAVLPYESTWNDEGPALCGQPVAEMNAILRDLDVHVSRDCCEPADHLAIELAALVAALDGDYTTVAVGLIQRLQSWVPAFAAALTRQDPQGFYAAAGELLLALLRTASSALLTMEPATVPVNEQREGEFA